jgi:two-component system, OmpR family, alkaline phosphatase synthesis response regulator PhoP
VQKKILVVDDDEELIELVRFNLKKAGFAIGTAMNGVEALKKARSLSPDLILLDLMLPELDGFAVCEILRRDSATSSTPIIMLTALSSQLGRLAGLDCGATDYVTKPFSARQLVSKVEQLLRPPNPRPAEG